MKEISDGLIISFFFPPDGYASGITVSKRIIENNNVVDVLQSKYENSQSDSFNECLDEFISLRILIGIDGNYDWANFILKFINKGLKVIKKDYKKVYSRSWLMANHFLACEYKFKNPSCLWIAEFSDPLIYDISNNPKNYKQMIIEDKDYILRINEQISNLSPDLELIKDNTSAYFIAEYLVYLFADKIIFTNENQREIMLNQFPVDVYDVVLAKSEIKPHPTLPDSYYHIEKSKLKLNGDYINIAYFGGDYYSNRHFEGVFYALESLNHKYKDKIRLYFFINDSKLLKRLTSQLSSKNNIIIKKPLSYLEFLNSSTKFDVLLVNDLNTKGNYDINPYLLSKLSDYLGSSRDIWAICEKGSSLSEVQTRYKSDIHEYSTSRDVIIKILNDHGYTDDEYSFGEYFDRRLTSLNELYEKEFRKNLKLKKELNELKSQKRFKLF